MTRDDLVQHPVHGLVTVLHLGETESLVRLPSGEVRTVTTAWLTVPEPEEAKPEAKPKK